MSNSGLLPSQAGLDHTDSGPAVIGVSWAFTAAASVFLGLRLYCKAVGHKRLFWDDVFLTAAWMLLLANTSITTYMVTNYDVGKHGWDLPPNLDFGRFTMITNARASIMITCLVWTKTAFAVTLLRLVDGWIKKLVWFIIITMNVFMGVSALMPWLLCGRLARGAPDNGCRLINVLLGIWISTSAYSAGMDFTLAGLPWTFLWKLQMRKRERLGVAIAMSFGIVGGIAGIVKCVKLPELFTGDFYNQVQLFYWDITEASLTIMAACIPALRVLIRDVKGSIRGYKISEPNSHDTNPSFRTIGKISSNRKGPTGFTGLDDSFDAEAQHMANTTRTVITGGHPHTRPLSPTFDGQGPRPVATPRQPEIRMQTQIRQQQGRPWHQSSMSELEPSDKSLVSADGSNSSVPIFPIQGNRKSHWDS